MGACASSAAGEFQEGDKPRGKPEKSGEARDWTEDLTHDQPEPNHPDIYHRSDGKDIIFFHITPNGTEQLLKEGENAVPTPIAKTIPTTSGKSDISLLELHPVDPATQEPRSEAGTHLLRAEPEELSEITENKVKSLSLLNTRHRGRGPGDFHTARNRFDVFKLPKEARAAQNSQKPQTRVFRKSLESNNSHTHSAFHGGWSSATSAGSSQGFTSCASGGGTNDLRSECSSHSSTCFELLRGSYTSTHSYEIKKRPFGMRIVDLQVQIVKGPARAAGILPGDELTIINGKPAHGQTWAKAFQTLPCPFTITMERFHPGTSGRPSVKSTPAQSRIPSPSPVQSTDMGSVISIQGTPESSRLLGASQQKSTPPTLLVMPYTQSYCTDRILAGRLNRGKSPRKASTSATTPSKSTASKKPLWSGEEGNCEADEAEEAEMVTTVTLDNAQPKDQKVADESPIKPSRIKPMTSPLDVEGLEPLDFTVA